MGWDGMGWDMVGRNGTRREETEWDGMKDGREQVRGRGERREKREETER